MVKYKVNTQFKENGKSLNDKLIEVLKIEITKKIIKKIMTKNLSMIE